MICLEGPLLDNNCRHIIEYMISKIDLHLGVHLGVHLTQSINTFQVVYIFLYLKFIDEFNKSEEKRHIII